MCCIDENKGQLLIRAGKVSEGSCSYCSYNEVRDDVVIIRPKNEKGLEIRLCKRHRKEIGSWRN